MSEAEILAQLRTILHDTFGIEPERIEPQTHLFEELDLDSIDAVDLAIKLQEMTGKRIKPEEFRNVRTVADVIAAVDSLLKS
jgi:acyl carrier protein